VAIGSLAALGMLVACLPPAALQPTAASAAELPPPASEPERCRALVGEVEASTGRFSTRQLFWGPQGVREDAGREGLVVGDADELVELTLERRAHDPTDLYGDAQVRCEEDVIVSRELPDGVAQPMITAEPACVGIVDGEQLALESSLRIVSAFGPYVGWREQVQGAAPEPTWRLDYHTADVRDGSSLRADVLLEPTPSMRMHVDTIGLGCKRNDAPAPGAIDGFAIRWQDDAGARLLIGYSCCGDRSCELDDPLPKIDPELAALLPDPDGLLHSPHGCGSIGLDGRLHGRDGAVVGQVRLDPKRVLGVVFLPVEHPYALDW
jgi:hypothetical protein